MYRSLNSRRPFLRDMSKLVGYFFKRQANFSCSMGEVVSKIVECETVNLYNVVKTLSTEGKDVLFFQPRIRIERV
jgi:hypothetical protein